MIYSGDLPWTLVPRRIMETGAAPLPPLVVVSATHGWGKTTWMRQYQDYVKQHTELETIWVKSRAQLQAALNGPHRDEPKAIFADLLVPTLDDPLWEQICDFAEDNPESIVVASSIDRIPPDMASRSRAWEVWERTLAFSWEELEVLIEENAPGTAPQELAVLSERLRGHPYLVRRHLERVRSASGSGFWTNPDAPTERLLLKSFQAFGPLLQTESCYLKLLLEGAAFRRFDLSMLRAASELPPEVRAEQFERLYMSPLGKFESDQLTGRDTFEWSVPAWRSLQQDFPTRSTPAVRLGAFQRTLESGSPTLALFYLLDLGRYADAEDYVDKNLRLFLFYTPEVVENRLFALTPEVLQEHPNLAILTGELLTRAGRSSALIRRVFQGALNGLKQWGGSDVRERYKALVRKAFCRVSLGDREGANRRLDNLLELLGTEKDPGPVLVAATADSAVAATLADELYLPFWTATQLDRHRDALLLASLMRAWLPSDSPTAVATALTAVTEEVFTGHPPVYPDLVPPGVGHSDALLLLEEGRGREALALVRGIEGRRNTAPTRSAAEALALTIRALEEPETLTSRQVQEVVRRSSDFWADGLPSTFVAQAASLAYLALQRPDLSREVLARHARDDWFISAAKAIERLVAGRPGEAIEAMAGLHDSPEVPRATAIVDVLAIAAYASLGQDDAACLRLNALWMKSRAPLIRYALRLVPKDLFHKIYGYQDKLHEGLAEILEESASDPHVLLSVHVPSLTKSETETLELLRSGRSYSEIAKARFVSVNTVRTQVRALYRKLQVQNREDAITKAEHLGLLR